MGKTEEHKVKSKIFATLAAGVMALASFAASAADTLRVGTHPTFAPFEFLDSASREYVGFDMDMMGTGDRFGTYADGFHIQFCTAKDIERSQCFNFFESIG